MTALLAVLAVLMLLFQVMPAGQPARTVADFAVFVFIVGFFYTVAVFTFGFECDVSARTSCYPARSFTLPVPTWALVFWPMLYGTAAVALAWTALTVFVLRPLRPEMPVGAMALFYAAALAWLQAVIWSPFPLPGLRPFAAVLVLAGCPFLITVGMTSGLGEGALLGLSAALIPPAYLVALWGVSRARCGSVAEWNWWPAPAAAAAALAGVSRRRPFASAERAQLWLEWRERGVTLPSFVGLSLLAYQPLFPRCEQAVEQMVKSGLFPTHAAVVETGGTALVVAAYMLLVPLLSATFMGASLGMPTFLSREPYALSSFAGVRPLSDAALAGVKLRSAALSALAAWAATLLTVSVGFTLADGWEQWERFRGHWLPGLGTAGGYALLAGAAAALVLLTWLQLGKGLFFSLTGRKWVVLGSTGLSVLFWFTLAIVALRFDDVFLRALPWLVGALALLKLLAAGLALPAVLRHGAPGPHVVAVLAGLWLLTAGGVMGLCAWLAPAPYLPVLSAGLAVVWFLPFTRLAAAPLAMAWNRHR
jgi:hypothetical protein